MFKALCIPNTSSLHNPKHPGPLLPKDLFACIFVNAQSLQQKCRKYKCSAEGKQAGSENTSCHRLPFATHSRTSCCFGYHVQLIFKFALKRLRTCACVRYSEEVFSGTPPSPSPSHAGHARSAELVNCFPFRLELQM